MLNDLLYTQNKLQERLGQDIKSMTREERTKFIKEHSIHATQEMHEMLYELPFFKPWKDYSNMPIGDQIRQWEKAETEFIDMLHFVLNIALALGLDEYDIYNKYMEKNKENHERQDEGYTFDKSYRDACDYRVGDRVLIADKRTPLMNVEGEMDKYLGTVMTISEIVGGHSFKMVEDQGSWRWDSHDIEALLERGN